MSEDSKGRIVIVGGDAAGMSAASVARRIAPKLEIAVLEAGQHISFAACGMPLLFSGELEEPSRLVAVTPEAARSERRLDLRLGHRVRRIDLQGRRVLGERVDGSEAFELGFDRLIIATGARPLVPPVPGVDRPGVFALRHLDHGVALERYLRQERPGRAVVAGAGYVGLDLAEALRKRGLSVTLLARGDGPLLGLEPELSAMVEEALARAGAVLLRGAPLYDVRGGSARGAGVVGGGGGVGGSGGSAGGGAFGVGVGGGDPGRISGVHAGGEVLPAVLLVLALGVRPASGLGEQAG
ncbi:MAG: FAD-dependent oxidoreductase, partial [Polyangia bacterium]|nr:FAD-dependent oxidoreductase [Polyangia bacterium]